MWTRSPGGAACAAASSGVGVDENRRGVSSCSSSPPFVVLQRPGLFTITIGVGNFFAGRILPPPLPGDTAPFSSAASTGSSHVPVSSAGISSLDAAGSGCGTGSGSGTGAGSGSGSGTGTGSGTGAGSGSRCLLGVGVPACCRVFRITPPSAKSEWADRFTPPSCSERAAVLRPSAQPLPSVTAVVALPAWSSSRPCLTPMTPWLAPTTSMAMGMSRRCSKPSTQSPIAHFSPVQSIHDAGPSTTC